MDSHSKILLSLICILSLLTACNNANMPKPTGYFRIELPEKNYQPVAEFLPFETVIPDYSFLAPVEDTTENVDWYNWNFPQLKATIYISNYDMTRPLTDYIETSREFVYKHIQQASAIEQKPVIFPARDVYGMIYSVKGNETASPIQFYLTDSTTRFLRGALYFNHPPDNDSIAPIISFIREDINVFVNTFEWD
ncbi:MAG: gliding motility protein GldD [Bacteroidales bacterium]|nr:gliding motility protein GldD [Bacteroidales bacterium]